MPRFKTLQTRFTQGELDPLMLGRVDVDQYYGGAETLHNVVVLPQGGVKRRFGLEYIARVPGIITKTSPSSATAPQGGTAANGYDDNTATVVLTTNNVSTTNPYVVLRYDMGAAVAMGIVYIYGLKLSAAGGNAQFYVQVSSDDVTYTTVGTALSITEVAKNFSRRVHGSYRYVRLARIGATDLGTRKVSVQDMLIYVEAGTSETREFNFQFNVDQTYVFLLSDKNIAIYQNGVYLIDIRAANYTSARLAAIDYLQSGDTMLLFHEDVQTSTMTRGAANDTWTLAAVTFSNIPTLDFGNGTGADEIQNIKLITITTNDAFTLTLEGQITGDIVYTGVLATTATNIQNALNALSNVGSGVTVAVVGAARSFDVTFGGAVGKRPWQLMIIDTPKDDSTVRRRTAGGEPIWSATIGWPRHGALYQGRLWIDGGKGRPELMYGSMVNNIYNFFFGTALADEAIGPLSFEGYNKVEAIYPGRNLIILTSGGEFILPQPFGDPLTPTNVVVTRQSSIGSQANLRPQEIEGGLIYVQEAGGALQEFIFSRDQDAFTNNLLSLMSSHLVDDPVDFHLRHAQNTEDGAYLLLVLSDGSLTLATILRAQNIAAFTKQTTDGDFKNCISDLGDMYFVIERNINGTAVRYLERFNPDCYMDCSLLQTTGLPTASFTATHLKNESCRVRADGVVMADATPNASTGVFTLSRNATTSMEIGLNFNPTIKDLPVENSQLGTIMGMPINISEVVMRLSETAGLLCNGIAVTSRRFGTGSDSPLDQPTPQITGVVRKRGWRGWAEGGQIELTQVNPEPMKILELAKRVNV